MAFSSIAIVGVLAMSIRPMQTTESVRPNSKGPVMRRITGPILTATLDLSTGELVKGGTYRSPRTSSAMSTPTLDLTTGEVTGGGGSSLPVLGPCPAGLFDNLDTNGFCGIDTGGGFVEWLDSGVGNANPSVGITEFTFAYCSAALDMSMGGPGGTMTWSFYPNYTSGGPHPVTSAANFFQLTGLPAHDFAGDIMLGEATNYVITVSLPNPLPLPLTPNPFGFGFIFDDYDVNNVHAATVPVLACIGRCDAPADPGLPFMDDYLDRYFPHPPGSIPVPLVLPENRTSLSLRFDEGTAGSNPATLEYIDCPMNTDDFTASRVVIGHEWTAYVTPAAARGAGGAYVFLKAGAPLGSCLSMIVCPETPPGPSSQLRFNPLAVACPSSPTLVPVPLLGFGIFVTHAGGGSRSSTAICNIPCNPMYIGMEWTAQALVWGDLPGFGPTFDCKWSQAATGIVGDI